MLERDQVFRTRLAALVQTLHEGEAIDPQLRRLVGAYAMRLYTEAGARTWADLKERADGPTYDSMLKLFHTQSEAAHTSGDLKSVRAFEVLSLSLIARRQYQDDLLIGVQYLDRYIAGCVTAARRAGAMFIPLKRTTPAGRR